MVSENSGDSRNAGIQEDERTCGIGNDGDLAAGVVLLDVHVRESLRGERAGDAVYVHRVEMFLHPLLVQEGISAALGDVLPSQRPLACANQCSSAAGGIHEFQLRQLFCSLVVEPGGGDTCQHLCYFGLRVVRGALFSIHYEALPEFPCEVVDVLDVEPVYLGAEVTQVGENMGDGVSHLSCIQTLDGDLDNWLIVHGLDDAPLL